MSLERADHVAAFSPLDADDLHAAGVSARRLSVLPPLVKGWDAVPSRDEARRRLGLPPQARVIGCATRFTLDDEHGSGKTQQVLDLLDCLPALPSDAVLIVAGDGDGRPRVEAAISRLGRNRQVRLTGALPHDKMNWFYAACDVFAYPCAMDRPWMAVLEAQACGRPVVTMHTRSAETTVDAGRTGLLADDLAEFRSLLAALVGDAARCESMAAAAREFVSRHHLIPVRVAQIEQMLMRPNGRC
jgi:phosphatidylinositol alpha-1,6-mannosyltransferase